MKLTPAILATLSYSNHFSFPLTAQEIQTRLIGCKANLKQVRVQLQQLVTQKKVDQKSGYYFLPGRSSLVSHRQRRAKLSSHPLAQAQKYAKQLMRIKGVRAIYVTGSLAMQNAEESADIDLMIIAEPGRLWTTRLLLTLYTEIRRLRRRPHAGDSSGKLCLNLYLTPRSYKLPTTKRSLYTAYELIQAIPLADPHHTQAQLLAANPWINNFLPNVVLPHVKPQSARQSESVVESLAYKLQYAYMRGKITREYITKDAAFFHPQDPSPKVE